MKNPINISEKISANLKRLASLLPKALYAVGGFVRDGILGYENTDIDLTGACPPQNIKNALSGTGFEVKDTSVKLMTLKISIENESYEYTTFRKETYIKGHSPEKIEYTDNLKIDALRRDFKANAVYYDILEDKIIDPLNGLKDIENKILDTTEKPEIIFGQDGLRLMRLARLCGELNFNPSEETLSAAKKNANLIKDIAPERIRDELDKILIADTLHNNKDGHVKALLLLDEIGVLDIILPEITMGKGMEQRKDFHKYDVFNHTIETFRHSNPKIRLAALVHDIAKPQCFVDTGRYRCHDVVGEELAENVMTRLRYPLKDIIKVCKLVRYHMYDLKCEARQNTLRLFVLEHYDILDELCLLKEADSLGGGIYLEGNPSVKRLKDTRDALLKENAPLNIKELKIKGGELSGIPPKERGKILQNLLKECVLSPELNNYEWQKKYIDAIAEKYK